MSDEVLIALSSLRLCVKLRLFRFVLRFGDGGQQFVIIEFAFPILRQMQTHRLCAAIGRGDNPDQTIFLSRIFIGAVQLFQSGVSLGQFPSCIIVLNFAGHSAQLKG